MFPYRTALFRMKLGSIKIIPMQSRYHQMKDFIHLFKELDLYLLDLDVLVVLLKRKCR